MSKDIEQEMAECEALQQRVWVQRIGGLPLKVYQAIGKASASLCMHTPDPCRHMHRAHSTGCCRKLGRTARRSYLLPSVIITDSRVETAQGAGGALDASFGKVAWHWQST